MNVILLDSGISPRPISARLLALLLFAGWLVSASVAPPWADAGASYTIDTNFPGGNLIVESIQGDTAWLKTDLRDTEGWWFYWNFRVTATNGQTLTFRFNGRNPIGVRGPAVSVDGGRTWSWLGTEKVKKTAFEYTFPAQGGEARFAFSMPYLESDVHKFIEANKASSALAVETLCISAKGRAVELLRTGCLETAPRYRILLTARHHACESMASYVLEGLLAAVLAEDEGGDWFRRNVEVLAVPFMDKDGVEEGDQGKNRRPRDHNRDYIGASIHPEVAALRRKIRPWSKDKLRIALDLHCPHIRGDYNEEIYIVGSSNGAIWQQQKAFGTHLETVNDSPLPYRASSNLPFGQRWNKSGNYSSGRSFSRWAAGLEGVSLAATMEIPYANANGAAVTADNARSFGHALAKAMRAYLESLAG